MRACLSVVSSLAAIGAVAAFFSFSGLAAAQTPSAECATAGSPRVVGYFEIVALYRRSENERALWALRHLSLEAVSRVIHDLGPGPEESVSQSQRSVPLPSDDCLQAAALLHTDFAMAEEESSMGRASALHWRAARAFINQIRGVARREAFRRNWLLTAGYYFQTTIFSGNTRSGFDRAKRYFDEAVTLFPEDVDVLVSAGALYEWNGSLPLGNKTDLKRAETLYRRAVAGDSQSGEARLRLGRALEKQGHYREAEAPLRAVLRIGESDYLDYFAHLFLGRLSERAGSVGEAIDHYRAATRLLPHWQVGYIALAHALRVSGGRDEAHATVARAVAMRSPFAQLDGWWVYERGRCGLFLPLLKRLREEVAL